jgi:hypothetical protein
MHVRSLLARVQKLEQAAFVRSPIEVAFGSLAAFEADVQQGIKAGKLCHMDVPIVLNCIRSWHRTGVWSMADAEPALLSTVQFG